MTDNQHVTTAPLDTPALRPALPRRFFLALRNSGTKPTLYALAARVAAQRMDLFQRNSADGTYLFRRSYLISTSRFGTGQLENSNRTPLGLHRVAKKIGGGHPVGTVFKARRVAGLTWKGMWNATIAHRILWLEGLESGFNQGGSVDTFRRYVYIHGFGDETTLGRPMSCGCIHVGAADLMPLFERLPVKTLVWISER